MVDSFVSSRWRLSVVRRMVRVLLPQNSISLAMARTASHQRVAKGQAHRKTLWEADA